MNARLKINMLEVTRLTRDGRLTRRWLCCAAPSRERHHQIWGETRNRGLKPHLSRWCHHLH